MSTIESISEGQTLLAHVIRAAATEATTTFFTGVDAAFQVGFVVYPAGGAVVPHLHLPVVRTVVGTSELLLVKTGRCIVDIYDEDKVLVASRELGAGDMVISVRGGHGFRMLEDTVLFEVKQGPYNGEVEKERFEPAGEPGRA